MRGTKSSAVKWFFVGVAALLALANVAVALADNVGWP